MLKLCEEANEFNIKNMYPVINIKESLMQQDRDFY